MRSYKKLLSVMLSLSLVLTACASKTDDKGPGTSDTSAVTTAAPAATSDAEQSSSEQTTAAETTVAETTAAVPREHATSSMLLELEEDGTLHIQRPTLIDKSSKVNDGTWTIFVYICGSNLESEGAIATNDMQKMLDASTGSNIKFVVETGGAKEWQNDLADAEHLQRFVISEGGIFMADEQPVDDMGKSETLSSFLKWGLREYPAQNLGLVLWNHGGGSISGVCFDDLYDAHSLSLRDIDEALLSINDMLTYNFEFISFDACLMATLETANILASHAYYMYASEDWSYGFDYLAIGNYLKEHPTADGAELGKVLADSYYDCWADANDPDNALTMSVVDLSKMDELVTSFNAFTAQLYSGCYNEAGTMTGVVRNVRQADNFGGNNDAVGYTNMVDLGGFIDACSPYAEGADAVKSALQDAVVYAKNGSVHADASGMALYYPLYIQGSAELKTFSQIAVSPYYLALVDIIAYGAAHAGDMSAYDDTHLFDLWGDYSYGEEGSDYWNYYSNVEQTGESSLITFSSEPHIDSDGIFCFTLSPDGLENTAAVQAYVYMYSEDMADILSLGISADVVADWDTGYVGDNFDGYWFSLPDGQNLAAYIMNDGDDTGTYAAPVTINGESTNIIFTHDYEKGTISIDGIWDGIDENGMSDRGYNQLKAGDVIIPQYISYSNDEAGNVGQYEGAAYTYTAGAQLEFDLLSDGQYLYAFRIDDIYGDYRNTSTASFTMLDGKAYYNE